MQASWATSPGDPAKANEDYAVTGPGWAVILDGATHFPGVDSGCVHDVPWLVRHLAAAIAHGLTLGEDRLPDVLAEAIRATCKAHADTCDLGNPDSPSSTVSIIRQRGDLTDYLVVGDSPVILNRGGLITPVHDDRTDHLPGGRPYSVQLIRDQRNTPGGFWVASTSEHAACEAISGTAEDVTEAALLTDGVTRLRDWYGATWADLLDALRDGGPASLIAQVRKAERQTPGPYGKRHDDATAVYITEA